MKIKDLKMSNKEKFLLTMAILVGIVAVTTMFMVLSTESTIITIILTLAFTLITFLLMRKQEKESSKLKVGDRVYVSGLTDDGEILEIDDTHAIIKTRVSKMKLSIKK